MIRFIKTFITMYVGALILIVIVAGVGIVPVTAIPIAIITAICALLWCWLN